ncbi:metalloendopeptidase [Elysia marginata]|uniref:Metalloendopeptidase n=1 Tax=Elysia marginata TaxID=1093978 RepID=A0AAV4HEG3_9GAST|nr:metalloendopeptidase [Elysia marginata]
MKENLVRSRTLVLFVALSLHVSNGHSTYPDRTEGEGVVEQYILAREEVEYELEDFYLTAAPGDEPDFHSDAMENLRKIRELLLTSGLPPKDVADLIEGDPGLAHAGAHKANAISRHKRTIEVKLSRRWTKGLVPYVFTESISKSNQEEIIRSMRTFERFTCIRFMPWSEENGVTTNQKLGLDHESYLSFLVGGGCWSFQGNLRKPAGAGGQKISCCGGYTCIHEIGHAMGESHEHQSPNPDRDRMIRINFDGIAENGRNSYKRHSAKYVKSVGYDLSSYMHYAPWSFRASKDTQTFYKFFPELPHKNSFFYLMREVSLEHKCQDKCSTFPLTCENDGYLTLVDNRCYCECIPGLDPETGCTTIFKNDPEDIAFPGGKYAIPAHSTGCPDDSFVLGSRTQINEGGNYKTSPFNLGFDVSGNKVEQKFCIHDSPPTEKAWPGANLCLYRRGGECPDGFTEGFVQYNDLPTEVSPNTKSGELPDGVFDDNTKLEYCCANTGFSRDKLHLPSRKPFVLIKRRGKDCQKVQGMHIEVNTLRIGNANDGETALVGGDHPMYKKDKKTQGYWTAYCNYKPAMIVKNDDLCYAVSDRGMTYDGDINFTRDFEPCLPWAKVSHCEMHPFKTNRFNTILQGNKCRNPDQGTGFQPWCFVKAKNCIRGYCDVCQIGKRFDRVDNCAELKASGQCSLNQCAKTCADQYPQPSAPVKASDVSCSAPGRAPDGAPVGDSKSSYAVGEAVKYKCDYSDSTKLRYCLTSGKWSSMGTACSDCPDEFALHVENKKCYLFPNIKRNADEAFKFCQGKGGFVAFPISEEENVLLKSFTPNHFFLGITDKDVEGTFVTATGEPAEFTKWGGVEPNNYGNREDCTEMNKASTWNDLPCTGYTRHFICQANRAPLKDCLDFSDKCAELFTLNPNMCKKFSTFADKHCRYTCGFCGVEDSPTCKVSTPEGDMTELTRGMSFTLSCDEGLVPLSGDEVRGCQADGTLSGKPLECTNNCPEGWTLNPENLFCYKKFDSPKNYSAAEADCAEYQGTLTTAADRDEQAFVFSLKGSSSSIWLALTDSLVEGTFRWTDGKLLTYSNWKHWEPNDYGRDGEDCAQMNPNGNWNDNNCVKAKLQYVCKVHVEEFGEYGLFWSTLESGVEALESFFG